MVFAECHWDSGHFSNTTPPNIPLSHGFEKKYYLCRAYLRKLDNLGKSMHTYYI